MNKYTYSLNWANATTNIYASSMGEAMVIKLKEFSEDKPILTHINDIEVGINKDYFKKE